MSEDEKYMRHCFALAESSKKNVKSNPKVGSVLVYNNKIIGQGCYEYFGGPHAERNAINNVPEKDKHLIKDSTLYVSLEPCCIHGKTPPCTDIILESKIKNVVISAKDPNPKMNGSSIDQLESFGVKVKTGVLVNEGMNLIRPFKANLSGIPYCILKFAQSSDGYFGKRGKQVWISNKYSQVLVHKWRSEVDGILIGFQTANIDNPSLTCRLVPGPHPQRFVIDRNLETNRELKLWKDEYPTVFISALDAKFDGNLKQNLQIDYQRDKLLEILKKLYNLGICSILIEGGANTIKWFIEQDLWHEARVITSDYPLESGIRAPFVKGVNFKTEKVESDAISYLYPSHTL